MGLDPGLGWSHRDTPYRDSAALDVLEALRPVIDTYLLDLLGTRTFSRKEFVEAPSGHVKLSPLLASLIARDALQHVRASAEPVAEHVARLVGAGASSPVTVRPRLTRTRKGRRSHSVGSACRSCGVILDSGRQFCDECLPGFDRERTDKLKVAGASRLAAMRASSSDPAQSAVAQDKRRAKSRAESLAMRAYEREHGLPDPVRYEDEILPAIRALTVPALMRLTGLSQYHCWLVREGRRKLHVRHWQAVVENG
jgi:hypothetical protein